MHDNKNGCMNANLLTSREKLIKMLLPAVYFSKENLFGFIEETELWIMMPQAFDLKSFECYTIAVTQILM